MNPATTDKGKKPENPEQGEEPGKPGQPDKIDKPDKIEKLDPGTDFLDADRYAVLDRILARFAPEAPRHHEHAALVELERLLLALRSRRSAQRGMNLSPMDSVIAKLNHDGYLAGALVQMANTLLDCWDLPLAVRLARELCDGFDPELGMALGDLVAADPALDDRKFEARGAFVDVHLTLGETLLQAGESARALRHFEAVFAIDIQHRGAQRGWSAAAKREQARGRSVMPTAMGSTLVDGIEELRATAELGAGRYELGRPLGRGRHAVVYKAFDRRVGRHVALKQLLSSAQRDGAAANKALERRFLAEAQTLARVRSRHVVPLYDVHPQGRYIAMEWCKGGSLRQQLRRGQIQAQHAMVLARQLRIALDAVHSAGAVHRDIKPANILIRNEVLEAEQEPELVLADFGLALGPAKQSRRAAGTLRYLAPEVRQGQAATPKSDLFSAGVVLLEIALAPEAPPPELDLLQLPDLRQGSPSHASVLDAYALAPELLPWLRALLDPDPETRRWVEA